MTTRAPAAAAMRITTAAGAVPCSQRKLTEDRCVFWAMKMISRTRSNAATTTAVQLALTRVLATFVVLDSDS